MTALDRSLDEATETAPARLPAPPASFEHVEGWGMAVGAPSRVYRPTSVDELRAVLAECRREGVSLAPRGSGCSYGDASVNAGGRVLDVSRFARILSFDRETGVAELEPGVTIKDLWQHALPRGYWPRVVSGTMFPTVAGAAAMNIHGKNNFAVGTIGDAIREFDLLLPSGELVTCSREREADLFHAAIGGFGMLGLFTRIVLETKRVYSGDLEVTAISTRTLGAMMDAFEARTSTADYLVGWIDCFGRGSELGRGLVHVGRYLAPGEDPRPEETLAVEHQELPAKILRLFPKSEAWRLLGPFCNDRGMALINAAKFAAGKLESRRPPYRQSHAAFAFLLDYVPNWKWAYGKGGLIQYQSFVPKETAREVYEELLRHCHHAGIVPYLGVLKRHRPDPFWLTHAVDGWSFAMDFKVTAANRERLWRHCAELTEIVLSGGGRFYFAKDLVLEPQHARRMFHPERLDAFLALKRRVDPDGLLATNLWRRLFA
jgi:decaprenylphospho-beta-D-ribofuranose 2-oxidase